MRFLIKVTIPTETGNARVLDGTLGTTIESILDEIKPEAAYWAEEQGARTGFIFCNIKEESDMPMIAEPFFIGLGARVEFHPAMTLADLKKAAPSFENAMKKYSPMKKAA